ncbi:hypothetical protein [Actinomadura sp. 9N215]|uniref:hypothetical protein n=1 Tax=Actinomadura sp. 9N215 TaxID=3375150 RepID=UPI0037A2F485
MIDTSTFALRLWSRRARRFVRWVFIRDRHDRLAMWHLDRLAVALAARGWHTRRRFNVSPAKLLIGPTMYAPPTVELTATHFGRWVYLVRGESAPIRCAELAEAVREVEDLTWRRLNKANLTTVPERERQR